MKELDADIVVFGAGIAGLWTFHTLKQLGYNTVLLETDSIGSGQTVASQGIIHSGLKYVFSGKINALARSISEMPDRWRKAMRGEGLVDLSSAEKMASSQYLLIPHGRMTGLLELLTKKTLGRSVKTVPPEDWPTEIKQSGFKGSAIYMDEPVLDPKAIARALAEPFRDSIRKIDWPGSVRFEQTDTGAIEKIIFNDSTAICPKHVIFTAAGGNEVIARQLGHDKGLQTQHRPLLMPMVKNAPFKLHAHCVGTSDKPVVTISSHKDQDGGVVWYLGGQIAERPLDADREELFNDARKVLEKYLPGADLRHTKWAALPINRVEGKRSNQKKLPDTPILHTHENVIYGWPTKLTFAPFLADKIMKNIEELNIRPSSRKTDWSFLPKAHMATEPWNKDIWTEHTCKDPSLITQSSLAKRV